MTLSSLANMYGEEALLIIAGIITAGIVIIAGFTHPIALITIPTGMIAGHYVWKYHRSSDNNIPKHVYIMGGVAILTVIQSAALA